MLLARSFARGGDDRWRARPLFAARTRAMRPREQRGGARCGTGATHVELALDVDFLAQVAQVLLRLACRRAIARSYARERAAARGGEARGWGTLVRVVGRGGEGDARQS